jgi:DNA-binding response OmpR family regulator
LEGLTLTLERVIQSAKTALSGHRRSILCVDDDADTLELLAFSLGETYEVATASDAQAATVLIEQKCFDLVILDTRLPDGTGIDLLHKIQGVAPNTPVLFVSADTRSNIRAEALAGGAQDYVLKPIDWPVLAEAVRNRIERSETQSLRALEDEYRVIRKEFQVHQDQKSDFDPARDERLMLAARRVFLRSGGTRAIFERVWPCILDAAGDPPGAPAQSQRPRRTKR